MPWRQRKGNHPNVYITILSPLHQVHRYILFSLSSNTFDLVHCLPPCQSYQRFRFSFPALGKWDCSVPLAVSVGRNWGMSWLKERKPGGFLSLPGFQLSMIQTSGSCLSLSFFFVHHFLSPQPRGCIFFLFFSTVQFLAKFICIYKKNF